MTPHEASVEFLNLIVQLKEKLDRLWPSPVASSTSWPTVLACVFLEPRWRWRQVNIAERTIGLDKEMHDDSLHPEPPNFSTVEQQLRLEYAFCNLDVCNHGPREVLAVASR